MEATAELDINLAQKPQRFGRRNFFGSFKGPIKTETPLTQSPTATIDTEALNRGLSYNLNRREVLKLIAYTAGSTFFLKAGPGSAKNLDALTKPVASGIDKGDKSTASKEKLSSSESNNLTEYGKTTIEQGMMILGKVLVNKVMQNMGIKSGNQSIDREAFMKSLQNFSVADMMGKGVLGPAAEEYLLRLLPSHLIANSEGNAWRFGIPLALLFAGSHDIQIRGDSKNLLLVNALPLNIFLGGCFYWYLMREKGFNHAVLAHSENNLFSLAVGNALFQLMPPEKAEKVATQMGILNNDPNNLKNSIL